MNWVIRFYSIRYLETLGCILCSQGELEQASGRKLLYRGLIHARQLELGNETHITEGHSWNSNAKLTLPGISYGLARVAIAQQQFMRAVRLFAAVEIRLDINKAFDPGERGNLKRTVRKLRAQLGEQAFQRAWSEGCAMTIEQMLGKSRRNHHASNQPSQGAFHPPWKCILLD